MSNEAMFNDGTLSKDRYARKPKLRASLRRSKPPKQVSEKQAIRNAFLAGVKAERMHGWIDGSDGYVVQVQAECGHWVDAPNVPELDDAEAIEELMGALDLHHVKPRSGGHGYRGPGDHGVDAPTNLQLLCRKCHNETGRSWTPSTPQPSSPCSERTRRWLT